MPSQQQQLPHSQLQQWPRIRSIAALALTGERSFGHCLSYLQLTAQCRPKQLMLLTLALQLHWTRERVRGDDAGITASLTGTAAHRAALS